MAKTTLKPWREENIRVEIETTDVLTKEEEEAVACGIRTAFSWCFAGEQWPVIGEIKQAIEKFNPALAEKIINRKYCW